MTTRRPLLLLGLVALGPALACGEDPASPPPAKAPPPATKAEPVVAEVAGTGSTSGGTTVADPFASDDGWGDDDSEGVATVGIEDPSDGTGGEAAPPRVFDGPCYVRWTKGPVLRFRYDPDGTGGSLRIDGDNDGTNDVCARFWTKDDRTDKVTVDEACDKSTDAIISPVYDAATNVATATYTDKRSDPETKHEITLVTLPAFTGIAPGYPLYAAKDDVELEITDGLVRKATVRKTIEGPAVKVTMRYDDHRRVTRIDEDHEADGKVDRRYDYRYDDVGNVTGITLTETDYSKGKGSKTKKTAKLGYGCWAETP